MVLSAINLRFNRFRSLPLPFSLVLLAGCANPGPPHPPSLHLPAIATGLTAERIGANVRLTWTTPDKTSDEVTNTSPITAVVCRELVPALRRSAGTRPCTAILRMPVQPGPSLANDPLPPALQQDAPHLLAYRVELLNPKDRSAGLSAQVLVAAGAAPPSPGVIEVKASRKGALIRWPPQTSTSSHMQVIRTPASDTPPPPIHPSPTSSAPKPLAVNKLAAAGKDPAAPVLLESPAGPDPGGMLDPNVLPHIHYTYVAQRIRGITLGGTSFELHSEPSQPVIFTYQAVFPPDAPSGLESIPVNSSSGSPSIDLSWTASPDTAVTGYNIYRSQAPSAPFERLNSSPVSGLSFRDPAAQPGHTYRYRVTALDGAGNESAPSPEITDSIPIQQ